MPTYEVTVGGKVYEVDAPDPNTAWAWANQTAASAPPPAAAPAKPTLTPRQRAIAAEREAARAELAKTEARWQGEPNTLERIANVIAAVTPGKTAREQSLEAARAKARETEDRLAREEAYIRRTGADPEQLTMLERIREGAKDIPRAAIEGFGRAASVAGAFGEPGERLARGIEERATGLAEAIGLKPDERAEFDPLQRNIQKVTSGLGSTVPFVATEVVGRKLQPVIKGAGAVARGAQVALGSGAGASEQRRSIEEYEAETGEKVDQVTRSLAQAAGGTVGLTEILPVASMVNRLPPSVRGQAFSGAAALMKRIGAGEVAQSAGMATLREGIEALERRALGRVGLSAAEEGAQEAGAQAAQNVIARLGYDPNQEIGEGVGEAALIGGLVGGAIRGGTEAVTGAPVVAGPEPVVVAPEVVPEIVAEPVVAEPLISEDVTAPPVPEVAPSVPAVINAAPPAQAGAPPSKGSLWQVPVDDLKRMLEEKSSSDEDLLVKALGTEGAAEFKRLDRMQNSSNPDRADEGARLFEEKFGDLTEEQKRLIYGIGDTDAQADDIKTVLDAYQDVADIDPDEWVSYMGAVSARNLDAEDIAKVSRGEGSAKAQAAFVRMKAVYDQAISRGWDINSIPQRMARSLVDVAGWKPAQAEEIVGSFVNEIAKARNAGPVLGGAPAPLAIEDKSATSIGEWKPAPLRGVSEDASGFSDVEPGSLGRYTDVVYRETSPRMAAAMTPGSHISDTGAVPAWLSNDPALALGQGENKGVLLEYDASGLSGVPSMSKPSSGYSLSQGSAEFQASHTNQKMGQRALRAVRVPANAEVDPILARSIRTLEADGWTKNETPDFVEWRRPASPPEPIDVTDAAPPVDPPAAPPAEPPVPPPAAPAAPTTPTTPIKLGKETLADKFVRLTANRMRRLGYVEEQIQQATGVPIPRAERPSEKAALFEGRATPRIDELQRDNIQPLLDVVTQEGLTANEVDLYLLARAAPARNAKIAERNPAMPDGGSGMTNADAQAYLDMFAAEGRLPALERMAERFDAMTERTRQTLVDYDLITPDQASGLVASEPQYAPFKGHALDGDTTQMEDETSGAFMSPGFTISPREFKPAKGRSTLPFSPLATAMADAQAAIIRGETNRYRKTFLDMVRANPSEYWQVFTEENPDVDRVFDSRTGKVSERPVNMRAMPDKYLIVKEGGTPQYIKINDPLLMRAMTNASAKEWGAINRVLGATIGAVTRGMSKLYTTLNPEFVVTNFSRDIQAAVFNVLAEQGRADGRIVGQNIVSGVAKDIGNWKNWRDLFRSTFNHTAKTPEQQAMNALFLQAKEDGAFTGWVQRESPELHMKKIQQTIADATAVGAAKTLAGVKKGVAKTIEVIEDVNSVFENSIRLAVYKNALEAGVTRDEAANMARNVTVDFNRKGELGPTFNSLYAFFNAAVQGNTQLLRSLTNVRGGAITLAQKAALGMVAIGFMRSLYNAAFADDDEDGKSFYDKIPDHVKQRNMVFMNPVDRRSYGTVPLPYGYSFFDNIGATVADVMRGQKDATAAGGFLFGGILNNFSPIPVNTQTAENLLSSFAPTAFKPLVDLGLNRNFFGSEIFNEPFVRGEALSANPRYNTPQVYKDITAWMNDATGGQGRVKGAVDVPAEALKYAVEQYIGGLGNLIFQSIDVGTKAATGRDVELGQIPFVRRLVGEPSKQADLGDYYDRINAIGPIERQLKEADPKERAALLKDHPVETDPAVMAARKQAMRVAKNINKQKRAILESDMDWIARNKELDRLNELQRQAYRKFNTVYNRVEKAEP